MALKYYGATEAEEEVSEISTRTASTVGFVLLGKLSTFIFAGIAFIIVARILGPSTYGIYTLALGVSGFFGSVGGFGVSTALNKFIPEYTYKRDREALQAALSNGYALTIIGGVALTLVTIAVAGPVSIYVFHNPSYTFFIDLAALSILSSMLYGASYSALLGFNKGSPIAVTASVQAFAQAALSIALVVLGFGAAAPIVGLVIGQFIGFFASLYYIYRRNNIRMLVMPSANGMRRLLSFSLPVSGMSVMQGITSNLSLIILGAFATTIVVGNFGIASRVNSIIDVISGSISVSLLSMFATTLASREGRAKVAQSYNYTLYYAFTMLAPVLLFIAVLAKPFSYVAFSGVYKLAPLYIAIMCVGLLIGLAGTYATTLLISAGEVRKVLKYSAAVAAVQLVGMVALVPTFKGVGMAVLIFLVTPVVTNALFIWRSNRMFRLNFNMGKLYRIALANAVPMLLLAPLMLFWQGNYIPLLITGVIEVLAVYPITLGLSRGIDESDIKRIKRVTGGLPVIGRILAVFADYTTTFIR